MRLPTTKKGVEKELDRIKEGIQEEQTEIFNLDTELMEVRTRKLGFTAIITGNYVLDEKLAAQRQHEELCDKENKLTVDKERAERRLLTLEGNLRRLEDQYQFIV
ncbi:hypothetical protein FPRO06_09029 [Fusarium proliferatum]|nr:hypothetical protein FPRO06_09029 [Fusarium proliferatum]CVK97753.1 uncharacterized protein FPRN_10847 [Fusarium proliferatum]